LHASLTNSIESVYYIKECECAAGGWRVHIEVQGVIQSKQQE